MFNNQNYNSYNYPNYNTYSNSGYYNWNNNFNDLYGIGPRKISSVQKNGLMTKTYSWMCLALAISFICSLIFSMTPIAYASNTLIGCLVGFIAEIFLCHFIFKKSIYNPSLAGKLLLTFAAINGILLSGIFAIYSATVINMAFLLTCADFGTMSIIGKVTKANLKPLAKQLYSALIALIVVGLIGLIAGFFIGGGQMALFWLVFSVIDSIVFSLLTIVDTNRLTKLANKHINNLKGVAVMGAFQLYLDFINLFLDFVQILGNRN